MSGHQRYSTQVTRGNIALDRLDLSKRTYNALLRADIKTVEELMALSSEDLWDIWQIGHKAIDEIKRALANSSFVTTIDNSTDESTASNKLRGGGKVIHSPYSAKLISELDFSKRTKNSLLRSGITTLGDLLAYDDDQLRAIRNYGEKSHEEVALLRRQLRRSDPSIFDELEQARRIDNIDAIARSHGINERPPVWSWVDLLDLGYDWYKIEAFDLTLRDSSLSPLVTIPSQTTVGVETVRYLLSIGCPLHQIPATRMTFSQTNRQLLKQMMIESALKLCLADREKLTVAIPRFPELKSDIEYYVEWLGTQSDWSHEIDSSRPSPVLLLYLAGASLRELTNGLFVELSDRDREIVLLRYGLAARAQPCTLQEIADVYGISRERVRQICRKAWKSFPRLLKRDEALQALIYQCREIIDRNGVIELPIIVEELVELLKIDIEDSSYALVFLLEISKSARYIKFMNVLSSRDIPQQLPIAVVSSVKTQLSQAMAPIKLGDLQDGIEELSATELRLCNDYDLVRKCLNADPELEHVEGHYWGLRSWHTRIVDNIAMELRRLNRPAHFREITELINKHLPENERRSTHTVHARLGYNTDLFVRTGPGTFALREWNPDLPTQPPKFIDLIEQVLEENESPLTVDEIFDRVNARREARRNSIIMYLDLNERFVKFDSGKFGLSRWLRRDISDDGEPGAQTDHTASLPNDFLEQLKSQALDTFDDNR